MIDSAIDYNYIFNRPPAVSEFASNFINRILSSSTGKSILFDWRSLLKKEIQELAEECSATGWDGEDALPISKLVLESAENFIDLLPDNVVPPIITPENTGECSFNWDRGKNMIYSIKISEKYAVYAGIFGAERCYGKVNIYDEMPSRINDIIKEYFKR